MKSRGDRALLLSECRDRGGLRGGRVGMFCWLVP